MKWPAHRDNLGQQDLYRPVVQRPPRYNYLLWVYLSKTCYLWFIRFRNTRRVNWSASRSQQGPWASMHLQRIASWLCCEVDCLDLYQVTSIHIYATSLPCLPPVSKYSIQYSVYRTLPLTLIQDVFHSRPFWNYNQPRGWPWTPNVQCGAFELIVELERIWSPGWAD